MTFSAVITAVFTVGYLAVTAWLCRGLRLNTRALCYGGLMCAATLVLGSFLFYLPTGSAISPGSWIPLMLLALTYDWRLACVTGWVTGILAIFLIPAWAPVHWAQIPVEHLVAFSALGYAGVFGSDKKWKVLCGVLLAIFLRFMGQMLSGVVFFSQNAWDGWGAWGYSITYHLSCKIPEGTATTLIMLALPLNTIKKAIGGNRT